MNGIFLQIISSFRVANPKTYMWLVVLVATLNAFLTIAYDGGVFNPASPILVKVVQVVSAIWQFLSSTDTSLKESKPIE
jgi:hypothetical protein